MRSSFLFAIIFSSLCVAITPLRATERELRIAVVNALPESTTVVVPINLQAQGNEFGLGFSVVFDTTKLHCSGVSLGNGVPGSPSLLISTNSIGAGRIGILVTLQNNLVFSAGLREIVELTFTAEPGISSTAVSFGSNPVDLSISDIEANELSANYIAGAVVMYAPPTITISPQSQSIVRGGNLTLNIVGEGYLLSYQWYRGNSGDTSSPVAGVTNAIYTITNLTTSSIFWARVSNPAGFADSAAATVSVCGIDFVSQPQSQTVFLKSDVVFRGLAYGCDPISYQWRKNGALVKNATNSTFLVHNTGVTSAGAYSLTASNAAGIITSSVADLTIDTDLSILAPIAGKYYGLFYETAGKKHESSGFFSLKVSTNASFSGKLSVEGETSGFTGKLTPSGIASFTIARSAIGRSDITANLTFDLTGESDVLNGVLTGPTWISALKANRDVWTKSAEARGYANIYTMLIRGFTNSFHGPFGYGYASMGIKTNGSASVAGLTGDNQRIKQTVSISKHGDLPLFVPMYRSARVFTNLTVTNFVQLETNSSYSLGFALGWLTVTNDAPTGTISWVKPEWTNSIYPSGFTNNSTVVGSLFTPPPPGMRVVDLPTGTVTLSGGNLTSTMTRSFTLTPDNKCIVPLNVYSLKVGAPSTKSGVIKGSFIHPVTGIKTTCYGIILQQPKMAGGFFLGTSQAGKFVLQ